LKILVTQMSQQDPLAPSGDLGSITEMASFSSLEELRTLVTQSQAAAEQSRALQTEMAVLKANALIGRTVETWPGVDGDGASIKGTVTAVKMEEGTPKIVVDGVGYGLDQLRTITQP
jgi:flagellar basal-body rod modification protein FlgD